MTRISSILLIKIFSVFPIGDASGALLPDIGESAVTGLECVGSMPFAAASFRLFGLWEFHRGKSLAVLAVIGGQACLIGVLLATLRRSKEKDDSLSLAAEAANIGLWQRKPGTEEVIASERYREIFGLPGSGQLSMGQVLRQLHPDDRLMVTKVIEKAASEGSSFSLEHRVVHPDGKVRWVSTHGRANSGGRARGFGTLGASIDITKRRDAENMENLQRQELAHLSRVSSLGVLSGALAHELNQPLGIILSNAQAAEFLLESETPDLVLLRAIITDIVNEDRRAGDVIKRLRALLRRGETMLLPVDVNANVTEVLRLTNSDLIARNVRVKQRLGKNLPAALADRVQLQQVLLNLIVNGCDAMKGNDAPDRVLVIETSQADNEIVILVRDRGSGLPEDVEELFKPFHSTKEHGLGMGLAISRTLIAAHDGRLWAEPNKPGRRGAVFRVSLPISP